MATNIGKHAFDVDLFDKDNKAWPTRTQMQEKGSRMILLSQDPTLAGEYGLLDLGQYAVR